MDQTESPHRGGIELVVYQVGELKSAFTTYVQKLDDFQNKVDKRLTELEKWKIEMETKALTEAKIFGRVDVAQIIMLIISLFLGGLITYLLKSNGVIK